LTGLLAQLPLTGLPPRALEVGCGESPAYEALIVTWPGWFYLGLDYDGAALRIARENWMRQTAQPSGSDPHFIQADARELPGLLRTRFGLILVRHPDLFRHRGAWADILCALPVLLMPGGVLVITLYAPEEVEIVETLALPPEIEISPSALPPVDLAGRDRLARAYRLTE
jgi:SAM-dependent methyltransferase